MRNSSYVVEMSLLHFNNLSMVPSFLDPYEHDVATRLTSYPMVVPQGRSATVYTVRPTGCEIAEVKIRGRSVISKPLP